MARPLLALVEHLCVGPCDRAYGEVRGTRRHSPTPKVYETAPFRQWLPVIPSPQLAVAQKRWVGFGKAGEGWQAEQQAPPPPFSQTCVIRAWDRSKPLLFCPAMNTAMWEHPVTEQQVGQLKAFGYVEIPCVAKKLVCGDQGGCLARLTAHSHSLGPWQGSASDPSLL